MGQRWRAQADAAVAVLAVVPAQEWIAVRVWRLYESRARNRALESTPSGLLRRWRRAPIIAPSPELEIATQAEAQSNDDR
jgi:hypothetical protein